MDCSSKIINNVYILRKKRFSCFFTGFFIFSFLFFYGFFGGSHDSLLAISSSVEVNTKFLAAIGFFGSFSSAAMSSNAKIVKAPAFI